MSSTAKICSDCGLEKPFSEFYPVKSRGWSGRTYEFRHCYCKDCTRARARQWHRDNPQRAKEKKAADYAKNAERDRAYAKKHRAENKELHAESNRAYKKANRARLTAAQNERQERNRIATPKWLSCLDRILIRELYEIASARSFQTGVKHHVDHIFPLKGDGFCGLNVPWNLRVIEGSKNVQKWRNSPTEFSGMFWNKT